MADYTKINITLPKTLLARIEARAGTDGNRSATIAEDLSALYDLSDRAERTVRSVLGSEQLDTCRAVLSGTFIEPAIVPHLVAEIEEGLEEADPVLIRKLRGFGLMELYALARIAKGSG